MLRVATVLICVLAAGAALAEPDSLDSDACRRALLALQVHEAVAEAALAASAPSYPRHGLGADARWHALRRLAASACLGASSGQAAGTQRFSVPPVAVPPVAAVPVPPPALPASRPPLSLRPRSTPPLTVITACDAIGCWASDGSRLHRIGPNLQGSRGLCSVHGSLLHCP